MKCDDREVLTWLARTTRILLRRVELLESRRYKHRDESYSRHVPLELPNASSGVLPRIVLCLDDLVANSACSQELSGEEQALDRADKVLDASGTFEFSADAAAFIPGGTAEAHLPDDAHVFGFDIHSQRLCLDEALPVLADASVRALAPDDVADPTSKLGSATRHLNIGDVKGDEHNFEVALEPPSSAEARLAATKRNPANARRVKDLIDDFDLGREVHAALLLMDVALLGELLDCEADLRHRLQGLPDTAARIQKTLWLIDMTDEAVKGLLGVGVDILASESDSQFNGKLSVSSGKLSDLTGEMSNLQGKPMCSGGVDSRSSNSCSSSEVPWCCYLEVTDLQSLEAASRTHRQLARELGV